MRKRPEPENVLVIDSDYEEANGCIQGLEESTKEKWRVALYENNKVYGLKRYIKFFNCFGRVFLYFMTVQLFTLENK